MIVKSRSVGTWKDGVRYYFDAAQVITGMAKNNAGNYVERMKTTHPEVSTNSRNNASLVEGSGSLL